MGNPQRTAAEQEKSRHHHAIAITRSLPKHIQLYASTELLFILLKLVLVFDPIFHLTPNPRPFILSDIQTIPFLKHPPIEGNEP